MHDLESIRHCVVFSLQSPETGQDGIVDALDEHHLLEWIIVLDLLVLLVPTENCILSSEVCE